MTARELFQAGQLEEAIKALGAEVRDDPTDPRRRTFLFELLCFAGEYDRAEKQLDVLGEANQQARMGALLYRGALHGERVRQDTFAKRDFPATMPKGEIAGVLNGKPFQHLEDADPRIGPRLELFAAGSYLWIPFEHIESIEMEPPKRLRDLLWAPAVVRTSAAFKMTELGEVLIPVVYPFSFKHSDSAVRLGRATEWQSANGGDPIPLGQKMLLVDGDDFPLLELRKLEFQRE